LLDRARPRLLARALDALVGAALAARAHNLNGARRRPRRGPMSVVTVKELAFAQRSDPGIIQFLAACTVPRLAATSALRHLPQDVVQRIARFAHGAAYLPAFPIFGRREGDDADTVRVHLDAEVSLPRLSQIKLAQLEASCLDVSVAHHTNLRLTRPILRGAVYVEIEVSLGWYGMEVVCIPGGDESASFGVKLDEFGYSGSEGSIHHYVDNTVIFKRGGWACGIETFDSAWDCLDEPIRFGFLVDMYRGCIWFRVNGRDGPCVPFPATTAWKTRGVELEVRNPVENPPTHHSPTLLSCRTLPCPAGCPSPQSDTSHLAAGTFQHGEAGFG
jgi:hypothetical protein